MLLLPCIATHLACFLCAKRLCDECRLHKAEQARDELHGHLARVAT